MKYIDGDLISLAQKGHFDVIAHGCNCFCTMGAGIAPQMAKAFGCDKFKMEAPEYKGDINKLGTIDYEVKNIILRKPLSLNGVKIFAPDFGGQDLVVINAYTQYHYGKNHIDGKEKPVDYEAIRMCMRKINQLFPGKKIGLPKIGAGLAGGNWEIIRRIIVEELNKMDVIIVNYKK